MSFRLDPGQWERFREAMEPHVSRFWRSFLFPKINTEGGADWAWRRDNPGHAFANLHTEAARADAYIAGHAWLVSNALLILTIGGLATCAIIGS